MTELLLDIIKEQRRQLTIAYELIEVQEKLLNYEEEGHVCDMVDYDKGME